MGIERLIPVIEIGERVLATVKILEMECPECGSHLGSNKGTILGTVIGKTNWGNCSKCHARIDLPEGWYDVKLDGLTNVTAFAYTELTPIKEDE